jgi:hypothetical protein
MYMVNSVYGAGSTWSCDGGKTVRREVPPSGAVIRSTVSLDDGAATHVETREPKRLHRLKTRPPMTIITNPCPQTTTINDPHLPKQVSHETVFTTFTTIIGEDNYVKGDRNKVYGNHNKVAGDNATVYGNYCVVRGTGAIVYGNNCSVIGENATCTGLRCQVIGRGSTWHNEEPFLDDIIPWEILKQLPTLIIDCPPETNKPVKKMKKTDEEVGSKLPEQTTHEIYDLRLSGDGVHTDPPPPLVATLPVPPTPQVESSTSVKK